MAQSLHEILSFHIFLSLARFLWPNCPCLKMNIKFSTAVGVNKCLTQIELHNILHVCAQYSNLPSNTGTIIVSFSGFVPWRLNSYDCVKLFCGSASTLIHIVSISECGIRNQDLIGTRIWIRIRNLALTGAAI